MHVFGQKLTMIIWALLAVTSSCTKKNTLPVKQRPTTFIETEAHPPPLEGDVQRALLRIEDGVRKCHATYQLPKDLEVDIRFEINNEGSVNFAKFFENDRIKDKPEFKSCVEELFLSIRVPGRKNGQGLPQLFVKTLYF